jgi:hypothetical protein
MGWPHEYKAPTLMVHWNRHQYNKEVDNLPIVRFVQGMQESWALKENENIKVIHVIQSSGVEKET